MTWSMRVGGMPEPVQAPPAVALLDVKMPGMTGIETLKRLRASGISAPVVMLTMSREDADLSAMRVGERNAKASERLSNWHALEPLAFQVLGNCRWATLVRHGDGWRLVAYNLGADTGVAMGDTGTQPVL